jgi:ABC-2 type transport system permease protein
MEYPDGQQTENISYLLTPIRGILAIWLMLCGFAASMYFMQDEQRGTFSGMPVKHRLWMAFEAHAVLLFDAVVILLAACRLAGVFTVWYREILSAVLFACCTIVFCNLLRLLCRTPEILGSLIPLLLLGMMILCPVFIKVRGWKAVQYLLPPYYYLNSVHSTYYLYGMVVYILILAVLCALVFQWKNKKYN